MNKIEARELLTQHLAHYQALSYDEVLRRVGQIETAELTGPSGQTYQVEVEVIRNPGAGALLLVLAAIDDGGWGAFCPVTADFLVGP